MIVGVLRETYPGEHRVALVPAVLPSLKKGGMDVMVESKAGEQAGYPDSAYVEKGATIASSRAQVFEKADCVLDAPECDKAVDIGKHGPRAVHRFIQFAPQAGRHLVRCTWRSFEFKGTDAGVQPWLGVDRS